MTTAALDPRRPGRLIRAVAGYSAIRASAEGLVGLRGVLLAALLGPAAFGSWALLRLGTRYATLAGLGVFRGLELELLHSHDRSAADVTGRSEAAGAALGFVLAVSGTLATIAMLASALVAAPHQQVILQGFAAAVIAEAVYGYVLVYTRVRTTLRRYAMLEAGTAALHLVLGVILTSWLGLAGAFAALAIAAAAGAAVASRWVEFRPVLSSAALRRMLQVGWPVALTGAVGTMLHTGDRWVVAAWGGEELLGYYAFAGALASGAAALALSIRTVVFPEVYGDAQLAGAATALQRHLERSLMPFAALVPPILGAVSFCIGPLVVIVAPRFVQAIAPARLFLLAGAAVGLVNLAAIGAVAAGRQRILPVYAAVALALNLGLSAAALAARAGLEGVAAASLVGHLLFAAAMLHLNADLSGVRRPEQLVARGLRPLVWCAAAVVVSGRIATSLGSEAAAFVAYVVMILPLATRWKGEWRRMQGER